MKWPPTPLDRNVPLKPGVVYKSDALDPIWGNPVWFAPSDAGHRNQRWNQYPPIALHNQAPGGGGGGGGDGNGGGEGDGFGGGEALAVPRGIGVARALMGPVLDAMAMAAAPGPNMTPPTTPKRKRSPSSIVPRLLDSQCVCS